METIRNDRKSCKCAYGSNMFSWETYSLFSNECWKNLNTHVQRNKGVLLPYKQKLTQNGSKT